MGTEGSGDCKKKSSETGKRCIKINPAWHGGLYIWYRYAPALFNNALI